MRGRTRGARMATTALLVLVLAAADLHTPVSAFICPLSLCIRRTLTKRLDGDACSSTILHSVDCAANRRALQPFCIEEQRRATGLRLSASTTDTSANTSDEPTEKYEALVSWLQKAGGRVHDAVQFTSDDGGGGRGLLAAGKVAKGEHLIVVPEKAQLFYSGEAQEHGGEDEALLGVIRTVDPRLWGMQLGLKLLQEKAKSNTPAGSDFSEYMQTLPTSYDGMPAYFTPEECAELQFPDVQRQAAARLQELKQLARTCECIRGTAADPFRGLDIDIGMLTWATASASSRAYRVRGQPGQRGGELASLLPIIDLINHSFDANCEISDASEIGGAGAVAVTALRDIASGEALRTCYGAMANDQLLLNYGFVLRENPHDRVELPVGALSYALHALREKEEEERGGDGVSEEEEERVREAQVRLLQEARLDQESTVRVQYNGELEGRSRALLHVLLLRTLEEVRHIRGSAAPRRGEEAAKAAQATVEGLLARMEGEGGGEGGRGEEAVRVVEELGRLALGELPSSLATDLELLQRAHEDDEEGEGRGREDGKGAEEEGEGGREGEGGAPLSALQLRIARKQILLRAAQRLRKR